MNWKSLFTAGANMSPDEVKTFMAEHDPDEYQLLDVRQPKEYRKEHIPGAILIPVKELTDRFGELDPEKPIFVYCHSGVRSKAASQLLLAANFSEIFNMSGGIIAYNGGKAVGGPEFGMELFVSGEFDDAFRMSYAMEEGLQQFYLVLQDRCDDDELKALLARLARFEEGHKAKLKAMFPAIEPGNYEAAMLLEGGFGAEQIDGYFQARPMAFDTVIQLGMMLETQAYDLYFRLAEKAEDPENEKFFRFMQTEEKQHLEFLSKEYDRQLQAL